MKKIVISYLVMGAFFCSCSNYYTDNQLPKVTPSTTSEVFTYTLSADDYAAIAANEENIALANHIDATDSTLHAEDSVTFKALQALATTQCFNSDTAAGNFLPAFIKGKFAAASVPENNGSTFKVTYRVANNMPSYLSSFNNQTVHEYTLNDDDYEYMGSTTGWLTGDNFSQDNEGLQTMMLEHFDDAKPLDIYILYFDYKAVGNHSKQVVRLDTTGYWNLYTIDDVHVFVAGDDLYRSINAAYVTNPAHQLPTYLKLAVPYAYEDDVYCVVYKGANGWTASRLTYSDGIWTMFASNKNKTSNFILTDSKWVVSPYYLYETFANKSQGEFTIQNVILPAALTYTWATTTSYGMKASAYVSGTNYKTEGWLISPEVSLADAESPVLNFDQAQKYAADFVKEMSVMVSVDYTTDVTTATWTQVEFCKDANGNYIVPDGSSWDFLNSGDIDLKAFRGKTVRIAFRYTSSETAAATWEVKNVCVKEKE